MPPFFIYNTPSTKQVWHKMICQFATYIFVHLNKRVLTVAHLVWKLFSWIHQAIVIARCVCWLVKLWSTSLGSKLVYFVRKPDVANSKEHYVKHVRAPHQARQRLKLYGLWSFPLRRPLQMPKP